MQNAMNYNLIVWEDVSNIPFPEEVKTVIQSVKWAEYPWQAWGLPIIGAKYTLSGGKALYLEELPTGKVALSKQELTGEIFVANYFVNETDPTGYNYFIEFKVTLLKGEVIEVSLVKFDKQLASDYKAEMLDFSNKFQKNLKRVNSWWYKWLYRPWYYGVRVPAYILVMILSFFRWLVIWFSKLITPI